MRKFALILCLILILCAFCSCNDELTIADIQITDDKIVIIYSDGTVLEKDLPENGSDGLSAYEIAVRNGFIGSESEWLESLKGDPGKDGESGSNGSSGKTPYIGSDGYWYIDGENLGYLASQGRYVWKDFTIETSNFGGPIGYIYYLDYFDFSDTSVKSYASELSGKIKFKVDDVNIQYDTAYYTFKANSNGRFYLKGSSNSLSILECVEKGYKLSDDLKTLYIPIQLEFGISIGGQYDYDSILVTGRIRVFEEW